MSMFHPLEVVGRGSATRHNFNWVEFRLTMELEPLLSPID